MFQIDRSANRLRKLGRTSFSEVGIREREHLQEWLASMPDALCEAMNEGEDGLLIIQKEFDGFDGTRERLDLLALDKSGQLVIIENKLDDSGRDVVWQALKYAAYCSSLKKAEIVGIFQQYLDRQGGGDAAGLICEFLGEDSLDEVVLNDGTDQRVVFIAASFRREVTATVLWLREHQIDARCIKVLPYKFGEELFIDLQQVIPTPEAADYMIRMAEKDSEEKSAKGAQRRSYSIRQSFWQALSAAFQDRPVEHFPNLNIWSKNWNKSSNFEGCHYSINLTQTEILVKLNIDRGNKFENKWIFDKLHAQKDDIERNFGGTLEWLRKDDRKVCRIEAGFMCEGFDETAWPQMIEWVADAADRLARATYTPVLEAVAALRTAEVTN